MNKANRIKDGMDKHSALEQAFFNFIPDGRGLKRVLKPGLTMTSFNKKHSQLWQEHEAAMIDEGHQAPHIEPAPERDLATELDTLRGALIDKGVLPPQ